ncbi:Aspartic proteinase CDR1 [Quillaja saponaria]|uniref:Aspartic proteinase CDR1 n=1 Tax=Quillaja saponaria TaxID=32244 RepID=A0AAD7P6F0_QUISA|nr:Aspartic proteinase CDR1 [Quillaja saponaria]
MEATTGRFTVDLIHRDSPLSPFYNQSHTRFDRLRDALHRSFSRINHFKPTSSSTSKVQSQLLPGGGEYLMNISIGTPPVEVLGIADTGSDLTWTQCQPCKECYKQTLSLFDPKQSLTYHEIPCESSSCNALEKATCGNSQNTCEYSYSYGDGSFTNGDLALDELTIGTSTDSIQSLPKIVFGCGHNNGGTFDQAGSGIVGLGGGKLSLVTQLSQSVGNKFSYCLVPTFIENSVSKISFGRDSVVSGSGSVTTPLVAKEPDTFYYLTLEAISVGNKKITNKSLSKTTTTYHEGNIIIDSGTTLTFLPVEFFDDLLSELEKAIRAQRVEDPRGIMSLCFKSESDNFAAPIITFHFRDADVKLQSFNTFARVDEDLVCFTMIASTDVAIFGNLAQVNFLVGFDLEDRTVLFSPADCTKQ